MQNIFDIHDYDEGFLERFCSQTIPIYDLWSIRPLQNEQKELITGNSSEVDKFRNFIIDHSNQDFPHPLVIVIGNSERSNSERMSNTSKKYFKLKFEKFKGTDLGTPLTLSGATPEPYPIPQAQPFAFNGIRPNPTNPLQGFSLGDIHGIIDRNVADATRSIKAEYEEQLARREAENIKRLAELETRMEMYKLDMRAREVDSREQELRRELEELERKKLEGLGTVKDYTKTIAGGLFELGKSAFGIEDKELKKEDKTKTESKSNLGSTSIDDDDDGFTEIKNEEHNIKDEKSNLDIVLQGINNLNNEQRITLLEALIPEPATKQTESVNTDNTEVSGQEEATSNNQNNMQSNTLSNKQDNKPSNKQSNHQESKENEDL